VALAQLCEEAQRERAVLVAEVGAQSQEERPVAQRSAPGRLLRSRAQRRHLVIHTVGDHHGTARLDEIVRLGVGERMT
jgi:hypothetical protein